MVKKCNKCGDTKPLSEFHKKTGNADGHCGHCKECQQVIARTWRGANPERKAATEKAWREANPDKVKARLERHKERWPENRAARVAVSNAIRDGRLFKQPCEVCGDLNVHGHHDTYSQPLEVRWLCPKHHTEHHMMLLCNLRRSYASTSPPMLVVSDVGLLSRLMLHNRVSQIMHTL